MKNFVILVSSLISLSAYAGGYGFDPNLVNAQNEYLIAKYYFAEGDDHSKYRGSYHLNSAHKFARFAETDHGTAMGKILILKKKYNCKFTEDFQK